MDKTRWENKAGDAPNYEPPAHTERTDWNNPAEKRRYIPRSRDTYWTPDIFQAAMLDVMQIPFVRCEVLPGNRPRWIFQNEDDSAWQACQDFINNDDMMMPLKRFKASYRFMQNQFRDARTQGEANYDFNNLHRPN